jgi:hypothetical protein
VSAAPGKKNIIADAPLVFIAFVTVGCACLIFITLLGYEEISEGKNGNFFFFGEKLLFPAEVKMKVFLYFFCFLLCRRGWREYHEKIQRNFELCLEKLMNISLTS